MKYLLFILYFLVAAYSFGQTPKNYMVVRSDTTGKEKFGYVFVNQKGDTLTRLDTAKYYVCFNDTIEHFAVVGVKHKTGWWAIDKKEKLLFQVFNTSSGEPSPDELTEGMIRIVDERGKIGFANYKGKIVIKPRFEAATNFYKGKSIIGGQCEQVLWCCEGEHADKHYLIKCKKTGYINRRGQVLQMGDLSFEQMQEKIGWKSSYED